jgi:hypothetical protein
MFAALGSAIAVCCAALPIEHRRRQTSVKIIPTALSRRHRTFAEKVFSSNGK